MDVERRIPHRLTFGPDRYTSLAATAVASAWLSHAQVRREPFGNCGSVIHAPSCRPRSHLSDALLRSLHDWGPIILYVSLRLAAREVALERVQERSDRKTSVPSARIVGRVPVIP
jgi:hypothetical protein